MLLNETSKYFVQKESTYVTNPTCCSRDPNILMFGTYKTLHTSFKLLGRNPPREQNK